MPRWVGREQGQETRGRIRGVEQMEGEEMENWSPDHPEGLELASNGMGRGALGGDSQAGMGAGLPRMIQDILTAPRGRSTPRGRLVVTPCPSNARL